MKIQKEYLIIDNLNQWLATDTSKKYALQSLRDIKECAESNSGYGEAEEIGDTIYLYEAKELKRVVIDNVEQ